MKKLFVFIFSIWAVTVTTSCNSGKIACPTYADSFPEKSGKKSGNKKDEPQLPKAGKSISGVLPPGYGKKK
jgi:hypothetical protein